MSPAAGAAPAFDWDAATPRERDGWVARFVTGQDGPPAPYTTCPSAEYELLQFVRETWPPDDVSAFSDELWRIYEARHHRLAAADADGPPELLFLDTLPIRHHQTGDYARAAFLASYHRSGEA
jgi:hypothetical protein